MSNESSSNNSSIEIWQKVIDVQMHFNDLCLRIRSFAVSILGVLLGASAIAYRFGGNASIFGISFPPSAVFILISMIIWMAFFLMDRYWYHELLRGSVRHGQEIEEKLKETHPEISLAHSIRDQSHKSLNMNAATKLNIFYGVIFLIQLVGLVLVVSGSVEING